MTKLFRAKRSGWALAASGAATITIDQHMRAKLLKSTTEALRADGDALRSDGKRSLSRAKRELRAS